MEITQHPAFPTFAICAALLVLKMIGVGHYTGILRIRLGALLMAAPFQEEARCRI